MNFATSKGHHSIEDCLILNQIQTSIDKLDRWIFKNGLKGYEPFDGLTSPLKRLTFNNLFLLRVLQQIVLRSPFHIRPLLGIKPRPATAYARAFIASGYCKMYRATGKQQYLDDALNLLNDVQSMVSEGYHGGCWGNNFDYASRGGRIEPGEPTIVWTSHIGHALLDAFELTREKRYLKLAESACDFIVSDLDKVEFSDGSLCISYVVPHTDLVHNANMLGASLLGRTGALSKREDLILLGESAIRYTVFRQRPDGSWYYGEAAKYHWIDNWHTAYNLDSLKIFMDYTGLRDYASQLVRGFNYFKDHFFTPDGQAKYYAHRLRFVDIQSASQAIDTLCLFTNDDPEALTIAKKIACWTIDNMQDPSGYFHFRKLSWKSVRVPMLHWGQGTMMSAMCHLYLRLTSD